MNYLPSELDGRDAYYSDLQSLRTIRLLFLRLFKFIIKGKSDVRVSTNYTFNTPRNVKNLPSSEKQGRLIWRTKNTSLD